MMVIKIVKIISITNILLRMHIITIPIINRTINVSTDINVMMMTTVIILIILITYHSSLS